jgi:cytochrome bd-type quinol oxidase subunit 2
MYLAATIFCLFSFLFVYIFGMERSALMSGAYVDRAGHDSIVQSMEIARWFGLVSGVVSLVLFVLALYHENKHWSRNIKEW